MGIRLIKWDVYEISSESTPLVGVMLRGRIRKLCLENNQNVLVENTGDVERRVRFAVPSGEDISLIEEYLKNIIPDVRINVIMENVANPILSKLKLNVEDRYSL